MIMFDKDKQALAAVVTGALAVGLGRTAAKYEDLGLSVFATAVIAVILSVLNFLQAILPPVQTLLTKPKINDDE